MATETLRKATEAELALWREVLDDPTALARELAFDRRVALRVVVWPVLSISAMLWWGGRMWSWPYLLGLQIAILGAAAMWVVHRVRVSRDEWQAEVDASRADIADGRVRETRDEIAEAVIVRDPYMREHHYVIARTLDDTILHRPAYADTPATFEPRRVLITTRANASGQMMDRRFEGERLDPGPVRDFRDGCGGEFADEAPFKGSWADLQGMLMPVE